ncbi:MAG: hypothetical protein KF756_10830 [Acidobacteria bacterium]|nr:hypothetical protein [Acidobacteriota bacterium]
MSAIGAFFTHIPESVSLLAVGVTMAATAAGLRSFFKVSKTAEPVDQSDESRKEQKAEG